MEADDRGRRWTWISWLPVQLFPRFNSLLPALYQVMTWPPHSFNNSFNGDGLSSYQGPGTGDTAGGKQKKVSVSPWRSHSTEKTNIDKIVYQMRVIKQGEGVRKWWSKRKGYFLEDGQGRLLCWYLAMSFPSKILSNLTYHFLVSTVWRWANSEQVRPTKQ